MPDLCVELGSYYRDGANRTVLMKEEIPDTMDGYREGYAFFSNFGGRIYRRNGEASPLIKGENRTEDDVKYDLIRKADFPPLQLEVGKLYRNSFGSVMQIVAEVSDDDDGMNGKACRAAGYYFKDHHNGLYFRNGYWNMMGITCRSSLVEEVIAENAKEAFLLRTNLMGYEESRLKFLEFDPHR